MKKLFRRLTSLFLVLALVCSSSVFATDMTADAKPETAIDENIAATIALLMVNAEIENTEWTENTSVRSIIPMYDEDNTINSYCINLMTDTDDAGYVIVSADLSSCLIQEYSDVASFSSFLEENEDNTAFTRKLSLNSDENVLEEMCVNNPVYYNGPLEDGFDKEVVFASEEAISDTAETMDEIVEAGTADSKDESNEEILTGSETEIDKDAIYEQNVEFINGLTDIGVTSFEKYYVDPNGIQAQSSIYGDDGGIINPVTYLNYMYSGYTFKNAGWKNLGESSVYSYIINGKNACTEYATAALLEYYIWASHDYNSIVSICKAIAISNGWATSSNYYISLAHTKSFVKECKDSYNMDMSVKMSYADTWAYAVNNIDNSRPFILGIYKGSNYSDHCVTCYAYTSFKNSQLGTFKFLKVKDGYVTDGRYVLENSLSLNFILWLE